MDTFERAGWHFTVMDRGDPNDEVFILLHGFPSDARSWDGVSQGLQSSGYRVLAPDQRGYTAGARPTEVRAYTVAELTADVLALADRAGAERFHLAGHDWGGILAWYLAAHHPDRLHTLSVVSTPHPRAMTESMWRSLQPLRSAYVLAWQVPALPEWLLAAGNGRALRSMLRSSGLPAEHADRYASTMTEPHALTGALNWYRAAARHPNDLRSVGTIHVPTLYVWSTADLALGRVAAHRTARHVDAPYRFVVLDGVSHWIPETEPDRLAGLLADHARSISALG